jgi:hypothetical protein
LYVFGASAKGTTHIYKVRAFTGSATGVDSATDSGYRASTPTYQWQRSAADSDASYSDISGGTTNPYNDTGAPVDGSGRYYKCVMNSAGASQLITNSDRGFVGNIKYKERGTVQFRGNEQLK